MIRFEPKLWVSLISQLICWNASKTWDFLRRLRKEWCKTERLTKNRLRWPNYVLWNRHRFFEERKSKGWLTHKSKMAFDVSKKNDCLQKRGLTKAYKWKVNGWSPSRSGYIKQEQKSLLFKNLFFKIAHSLWFFFNPKSRLLLKVVDSNKIGSDFHWGSYHLSLK